jgi:hypothetical protein
MEAGIMSKLEHLLQQAARAERLSKAVLDTLTINRLQAFAAECRAEARALPGEQPTSSPSQRVVSAA